MEQWRAGQFGEVIDRFRHECSPDAWNDILMAYSMLVQKGPSCGRQIATKLVNGKGIWELIGHAGNEQPRPLFYFWDARRLIVFVHAFTKKGRRDYKPAIRLAQSRRRLIEREERPVNVIQAFTATRIH